MSRKPKMELAGHDGNIFSILGRAGRLLKENGMMDQTHEMNARVFGSGSYEEALRIISEYVETELSPARETQKKPRRRNDHAR